MYWGDEGSSVLVRPSELKSLLSDSGQAAEYEWLIPMELLDGIGDGQDIYRSSYSVGQSRYSWTLGRGNLRLKCDETYQTWDAFRVEAIRICEGLTALLEAQNTDVASMTLQYVDVFRSVHFGGKTAHDFLQRDLGFALQIPAGLSYLREVESANNCTYTISREIQDNFAVHLNIGESPAFVDADSVVSEISALRRGIQGGESKTAILEDLHQVTDNLFFSLVDPVSSRFESSRGGNDDLS
jgi:uncharacterized protein (TIGR04255 family)